MSSTQRMPKDTYERELERLQIELTAMQRGIVQSGMRVLVLFEGRDAAGKGGAIKRIAEHLNPRSTRVVALPQPSERDKGQWYFQRYVAHLPARGEIVLMDRSWYNRAGVERVMGYCTDAQYELFLQQAPVFEKMLVDDGIVFLKYWFSVSDKEQQRRFKSRLRDPMRRWKLSETDLQSITRWEDYSRAKDAMFDATDSGYAPWWTINSDDKRAARINVMSHLISQIDFERTEPEPVKIPKRPASEHYVRPALESHRFVPDIAAKL